MIKDNRPTVADLLAMRGKRQLHVSTDAYPHSDHEVSVTAGELHSFEAALHAEYGR